MRKLFNLLAAALVVLAAAGCDKNENLFPDSQEGKVITLSATIDNGGTKTSLGDPTSGEYPVLWSANDQIALIQGTNVCVLTLSSGENTTTATFTGTITNDFNLGEDYTAFYPASAVNTNTGAITISGTQTYAEKSFGPGAMPMAATGNAETSLRFNNLFGVVKVIVKGAADETLESIEFGSTAKLCGDCILSNGNLTISDDVNAKYSSNITLDCDDTSISIEKEFLIAIPGGGQKFAIVLHTNKGSYYKSTNNNADKNITNGNIYKMSKIDLGNIDDQLRVDMSITYKNDGDGILLGRTVWAPVNETVNWGVNDGCPEGWRLATEKEWRGITPYFGGIRPSDWVYKEYYYNVDGCWFYGITTPPVTTKKIFLPLTYTDANQTYGLYRTSTPSNTNGKQQYMRFKFLADGSLVFEIVSLVNTYRNSMRCVKK